MKKLSNYIKHKEDFLFRINREGYVSTDNGPLFSSKNNNVSIYFTGICYNYSVDELYSGFEENGPEFVSGVKGLYLIFLVIKGQLHILTDKTHSNKAYFLDTGNEWVLSNNFDLIPKNECSLNKDAIACYLANGAMLSELTLFNEITSTKPSSIHSFINSEVKIKSFWSVKFDYDSTKPVEFYQSKMEKLLINSVKEIYKTVDHKTFLSLSGGYDARTILGILSKFIKADSIQCFSYGSTGFNQKEGDILVSKELAKIAGYPHEGILNYDGNYIKYISRNANLGKGMYFFCDELDAWDKIAAQGSTDVIMGDEFFGHKDFPLNSNQEIFDMVQINGSNSIRPLKEILPKNIFSELSLSIQNLNNEIIQKVSSFDSVHDKKDYLFFHANLSSIILPVRNNIASITGYLHNPFLYDDLLEFVLTLPPSLRLGKGLFKKSAQNIIPEFFSTHIVSIWGDETNHRNEIIKNRKVLIERIKGSESELDEVIDKHSIIQLIEELNPPTIYSKFFRFTFRVIQYFRRYYSFINDLLEKLRIPRIPVNGFVTKKEILILRLLLLRESVRTDKN